MRCHFDFFGTNFHNSRFRTFPMVRLGWKRIPCLIKSFRSQRNYIFWIKFKFNKKQVKIAKKKLILRKNLIRRFVVADLFPLTSSLFFSLIFSFSSALASILLGTIFIITLFVSLNSYFITNSNKTKFLMNKSSFLY